MISMKEAKQVTIYLQPKFHKELKLKAVKNNTSISQIIQALVEDYLRK
jgi:hypothetical protein